MSVTQDSPGGLTKLLPDGSEVGSGEQEPGHAVPQTSPDNNLGEGSVNNLMPERHPQKIPQRAGTSPTKLGTKHVPLRQARSWPLHPTERPTTTPIRSPVPKLTTNAQPKFAVDASSVLRLQDDRQSELGVNTPPISPLQADGSPRAVFQAPETMKTGIDQVAGFWESYNRKADFEDREFVKALGASLDVLLIFAGLFSGVNTAFILESLKPLQQDQSEKTNRLLNSVILTLRSLPDPEEALQDDPFVPTRQAVRCNAVFFASLCCSLTAAFGAVLGKQWLNNYEREGGLKPPPEKARERQRKSQGCEKWHLEAVIESLPTVLQVSLYLFLIGLVDFLRPMNDFVATSVTALALVPLLLHLTTTTIASLDSSAPFQTRLSIFLRESVIPLGKLWWKRLKREISIKLDDLRYGASTQSKHKMAWKAFRALAAAFVETPLLYIWKLMTSVPFQIWKTFSSQEPSSKNDLLNLGCVIFSMKRASTQQEMNAVVAGMAMIPMSTKVYENDPIITSLVETVFAFLFKPLWHPFSHVQWGGLDVYFEDLLNVLPLILFQRKKRPIPGPVGITTKDKTPEWTYEERVHYGTYEHNFLVSLHSELWRVLLNNPLATESVKSSASILLQLQEINASFKCHESLAVLTKYFKNPEGNSLLMTTYLDLLSIETFHDHHSSGEIESVLKLDGVKQALVDTMWKEDSRGRRVPDLDYHRGRLRIERLPMLIVRDDLKESEFDVYLWKWFQKHIRFSGKEIATGQDSAARIKNIPQVIRSYLMSLGSLIETHGYPLSELWPASWEEVEHATCLGQILKGEIVLPEAPQFTPLTPFSPVDTEIYSKLTARFDALYCIVTLWLRSNPTKPPWFLGIFIKHLAITEDQLDVWDREFISSCQNSPHRKRFLSNMEAIMLCLEELTRKRWLVHSREAVVKGYRRWGGWVLTEDECLPLFQRLDDLPSE